MKSTNLVSMDGINYITLEETIGFNEEQEVTVNYNFANVFYLKKIVILKEFN